MKAAGRQQSEMRIRRFESGNPLSAGVQNLFTQAECSCRIIDQAETSGCFLNWLFILKINEFESLWRHCRINIDPLTLTSLAWVNLLIFPMKNRERYHSDVLAGLIVRMDPYPASETSGKFNETRKIWILKTKPEADFPSKLRRGQRLRQKIGNYVVEYTLS